MARGSFETSETTLATIRCNIAAALSLRGTFNELFTIEQYLFQQMHNLILIYDKLGQVYRN
jgi:hypothetical protein